MHIKRLFGLSVLSLALVTQLAFAKPHYNVNDYYQVYKDGRIYIFDDFKTYDSFIQVGETAFRLTRIGAGPNGETVVFGLQGKDKELSSGLGAVDLFDGKTEAVAKGFYGEVIKENRIFVFSEWADLKSFLAVGEAPFRYTQIAAGPNAETLVFVLNAKNKEKKPDSLIAEFKRKHSR